MIELGTELENEGGRNLSDLFNGEFGGEIGDRMMKAGAVRSYGSGVTVFSEGEIALFLPTVLTGSVKMVRYPEPGKELIIGTFAGGEIFAIPPAIDGKEFPATAVTMEESRLLIIPRDRFCRMLEDSPQFSAAIMRRMCGIMRDRSEKIRILSRSSAEQRIAKVLVSIADTSAPAFPMTIRLRRQDIAEMAGQTLESTIRTIRRLNERGLLRIERGKIVLPEIDGLRRLSEL